MQTYHTLVRTTYIHTHTHTHAYHASLNNSVDNITLRRVHECMCEVKPLVCDSLILKLRADIILGKRCDGLQKLNIAISKKPKRSRYRLQILNHTLDYSPPKQSHTSGHNYSRFATCSSNLFGISITQILKCTNSIQNYFIFHTCIIRAQIYHESTLIRNFKFGDSHSSLSFYTS